MEDSKDEEKTDYSGILELYGSDDEPMVYMIEPRGSVRYMDKGEDITAEDLQDILPEISQ